MIKPHRVVERFTGYANEAAAFVRRRRHARKPFARVYRDGGHGGDHGPDTEEGRALFRSAARLIDLSRR